LPKTPHTQKKKANTKLRMNIINIRVKFVRVIPGPLEMNNAENPNVNVIIAPRRLFAKS
jgi:hypothetical protein